MAQTFQHNGSNLTYITQAYWENLAIDTDLAGQTIINRWRLHRWQTNVMSAAEYAGLRDVLGQRCDITTTNYSNPNGDYTTYYGAVMEQLQGEHTGPVYQNVQVLFRVRL